MDVVNHDDSQGQEFPTSPGLVRYKVWIPVPNLDGADVGNSIQFTIRGLAVPRIGESVHFDDAPVGLKGTVVHVAHWFSPSVDGEEDHEIVAEVKLLDSDVDTARLLLDAEALRRWIARFPHLEYDEDPSSGHR
ncbi:hypothetical protein VMT65_31125 [Nocardia sp. CDC153]|uniref:hypothetical protein n=1 Tax=Nocardia sp. CDC153 TaxID=3112167 RepID=UPI002DBCC60D|nr:hypothetical protein [Nocardia sp. CDC153]MEC3957522.1 hypothetical protein [Nocardia sp. CDC153]